MTETGGAVPGLPSFVFATCQVGAEPALKAELASRQPELHLAFSRPGFLTFKRTGELPLPDEFELGSVFARASGLSLGRAAGDSLDATAASVWKLVGNATFDRVHVWERDRVAPGYYGFEPGMTARAVEAAQAIERAAVAAGRPTTADTSINQPALPGDVVLDCVLIEPHELWVGFHRAAGAASRQPGGMWPLTLPEHAVSRAYLKMEEALHWSELPLRAGDCCVELGCAPGGASQALLARGLNVIGIDPAEVDPRVMASAGFTHLKKRGADVRRREFRDVRWLAADMNVAPSYTLDTVESIVTHGAVHIQGLLLTLKLLQWELADEIPDYLQRVRSWGYPLVQARQLAHNRQEICVAAQMEPLLDKHTRRQGRAEHGAVRRRRARDRRLLD